MNIAPKEEHHGILTEEDTADWLRIKRDTLRKWRREGSGPDYIRCGERLIRYFISDIVEWLSQNKNTKPTVEQSKKARKRRSIPRTPARGAIVDTFSFRLTPKNPEE